MTESNWHELKMCDWLTRRADMDKLVDELAKGKAMEKILR